MSTPRSLARSFASVVPVFALLSLAALVGCSGSTPADAAIDAGTTNADPSTSGGSDTSDPGTADPGTGTGSPRDADAGPSTGGSGTGTVEDGGMTTGSGDGGGNGNGNGNGGHADAGTTVPMGDAGTACPSGAQMEAEPNDSAATANVVQKGAFCGSVGGGADSADYLTFSFAAGQSYTWKIPQGSRVSVSESRTGNTVTLHVMPRPNERSAYVVNVGIQ